MACIHQLVFRDKGILCKRFMEVTCIINKSHVWLIKLFHKLFFKCCVIPVTPLPVFFAVFVFRVTGYFESLPDQNSCFSFFNPR